ncbi:MAG: prepilin-type N-terminal cleavage/methylation domain-containing protein [Phycisphaerales bacterium]|nr:prepilin-type N-terminal cleavage/methylation domain-containing protein [Phycisphaerales bacterium]
MNRPKPLTFPMASPMALAIHDNSKRGFTLVELIAVIAIVALLIALLLPALRIAKANGQWAASQNNLRQIASLMHGYTADNRDTVLPSQFDHRAPLLYKGAMRAPTPAGVGGAIFIPPPIGLPLVGTWADILWTTSNLGTVVMPELDANGETVLGAGGEPNSGFYNYRNDSPDRAVYRENPGYDKNILRSVVGIKRPFSIDPTTEATPWGIGASEREIDHAGYFAANDFFSARALPGARPRYYPLSQIHFPATSVYLVDSCAGEVIAPLPNPWMGSNINLCEVDFRYPGSSCLMLCLDGHVQPEVKWDRIEDLQRPYYTAPADPPTPGPNDPDPRGLRISNLDRSDNPAP